MIFYLLLLTSIFPFLYNANYYFKYFKENDQKLSRRSRKLIVPELGER